MRIAQVAPLYESVPPKLYGGTERIVSYLTEELVAQGHDVTLFASGDSLTQAKLVPGSAQSLRLDDGCIDKLSHHVVMLEKLVRQKDDFDVIHFHTDYLAYSLVRSERLTAISTLHGRLDLPDLVPLYSEFRDVPVISISDSQRTPLPWLNWVNTVYHGIPEDQFTFRNKRGKYLAFLGRTSPEKGLDEAIRIAQRVGIELRIAAKVDPVDKAYFESTIRPMLAAPGVEFVGEIGYPEKDEFLGNAYALLFPICWPEPFGLVMIEAMACGTPVIAYRSGSVPEVMEDGVSGYVVNGIDEAASAIERLASFDRQGCRNYFEKRFTATRMCQDYVAAYQRLLQPAAAAIRPSDEVMSWTKTA